MSASDLKVVTPITLDDTTVTSTTVAEDEYAAWDGVTTYAAGDVKISAHKVWASLQAANLNNDPATSPAWWKEIGPSNAWSMFDNTDTTATVTTDSAVTLVLTPGTIDSVYLSGLVGVDSVQATLKDAPGGTVQFDQTQTLAGSTVPAWVGVFSTPSYSATDVLFSNLPAYPTGELTVVISGTNVQCASFVAGLTDTIGQAKRGMTIDIRDFSRAITDEFGKTKFVKRARLKRMTGKVHIENSKLNKVRQILENVGSTPTLYIGASGVNFDPLRFIGYYSSCPIDITYIDFSECSLQVEGL